MTGPRFVPPVIGDEIAAPRRHAPAIGQHTREVLRGDRRDPAEHRTAPNRE